jgi:hypothetical protein
VSSALECSLGSKLETYISIVTVSHREILDGAQAVLSTEHLFFTLPIVLLLILCV